MPAQRKRGTGSIGSPRRDGRIPVSVPRLKGKGRRVDYVRDEADAEAKLMELYQRELAEADLPQWIDDFVARWNSARADARRRDAAIAELVTQWERIAIAAKERARVSFEANEIPDRLGTGDPRAPRAASPQRLLEELRMTLNPVDPWTQEPRLPDPSLLDSYWRLLASYPEADDVGAALREVQAALAAFLRGGRASRAVGQTEQVAWRAVRACTKLVDRALEAD